MPTALRMDPIRRPRVDPSLFETSHRDIASLMLRLERESLALDRLRANLERDEALHRPSDPSALAGR